MRDRRCREIPLSRCVARDNNRNCLDNGTGQRFAFSRRALRERVAYLSTQEWIYAHLPAPSPAPPCVSPTDVRYSIIRRLGRKLSARLMEGNVPSTGKLDERVLAASRRRIPRLAGRTFRRDFSLFFLFSFRVRRAQPALDPIRRDVACYARRYVTTAHRNSAATPWALFLSRNCPSRHFMIMDTVFTIRVGLEIPPRITMRTIFSRS